uniref:Palladin n=1 Tax=Anabas testudineus TaxID=64144 RepID=A0A7N6AHB1_ANATE
MQDGSWNQPLPISLLLKDSAAGGVLEGDGGMFSEASSDGELYLDSATELDSGDGDFADLTAFLSVEEINRSLDLAREAFGGTCESEEPASSNPTPQEQVLQPIPSLPVNTQTSANLTTNPSVHQQTKTPCTDGAIKVTSSQNVPLTNPLQVSSETLSSAEKVVRHKPMQPVYKQDKPRLVHEDLELNDRVASATEFCSRAATFIEELSSIFRGSARLEQQLEEDSSSPDSGYLSPRSQRPVPQGAASGPTLFPTQQVQTQNSQPDMGPQPEGQVGVSTSATYQNPGAAATSGNLCPPHFLQKLKSQEVAAGSPICLECRVRGSPQPLVRWFCEGRELHNSPDIQILRDGDLHTLVIAEAFEDDTGRYTCVASNSLGADNTSAEVYIEVQKKMTSMSLTIRSSSPKTTDVLPRRSTLVQSLSQPPQRVKHLKTHSTVVPHMLLHMVRNVELLQDAQASEGQVVVLECRVRGSPPLQVQWYRQGEEILDSPDFRILQKKPRSAAEPEEICTLVIAEAFPEDGGLFCCTASNPYGSINSTARLTVTAGALMWEFLLLVHLNQSQLKQLQDQILLEQQEASNWQQQEQQDQEVPPPPQQPPQEAPPPAPPSPPLPPPPSFQELESSVAMQASTFNYARPKQFIAAQSPGGAGYITQSSGSSGSNLSSPLSPPTSHKTFTRVTVPPFSKAGSVESPSSPSFPPPPPPFLSSSNLPSPSGPAQDFPPPPPPPPPPVSLSPAHSDMSSPFSSVPPSPASSFLSSVLPSTPSSPSSSIVNALGLPKGNGTVKAFPRKSSVTKTPRIASDSDIQGSKDAVIQDLERKLRFKEERISNGQQRLTYEEKMARRLLGADNAATVLNTQDTEEEPVTQEYKVSSFEQRLISEIEFRLERSPVEESDDDVQHDEDSPGQGVAPSVDQKLKHYKVFEGMPVTFSCKVNGDPKPKVYWFKDGKQISKRSEHYRISRDPDGTCSLHTAAASLDDDGNYTIMAGNPMGRVSCTGRMMVQAVNQRGRSQRSTPGHMRRPRSRSRDSGDENDNIQERHFRPHFLQAPGDLIVQEGRLCRMDCKVSGLPTPDLIWQLNGQTIRPDSAHKMLVRENGVHSLVIEPVTSRDAGIYTCIASNRAGQNSFNLELIVAAKEMHKAPSFIEKLQNTSVAEGHPVRLECRVTGVPYPQIFWKRENESFTHNTDRISMHQDNCGYLCMIIQPALKEDAGWYTVSAKNDAGIVSSTARLDVHTQWQQPNLPKPKKVRPSTSRYAALTERGLDVKAAFFPESSPLPPGGLVESDDL